MTPMVVACLRPARHGPSILGLALTTSETQNEVPRTTQPNSFQLANQWE